MDITMNDDLVESGVDVEEDDSAADKELEELMLDKWDKEHELSW